MESSINPTFKRDYQTHLQHLSLKGLQPKTTEAYARAIRLPDIVSIEEAERMFLATNKLSYRVFYFIVYSLQEEKDLAIKHSQYA